MQFFLDKKITDIQKLVELFPFMQGELDNYPDELELHLIEGKLFLKLDGLKVDINAQSQIDYHTKFFYKNSLHKQPLAKALGLKRKEKAPWVLDLTTGVMKDTILLHTMGFKVSCVERNPLVASLIQNTLDVYNLDMNLLFTDAKEAAKSFAGDCLYYDPMFDEKNNKALPSKEMQLFRKLLGVDEDCFETAKFLQSLGKRVVIKRSMKASPLLDKVDIQFGAKSTRYDVYLPKNS